MFNFFKPTSLKFKVTFILIAYILFASIFLASYNQTRSISAPRQLNMFDNIGIVIALPAIEFLTLPMIYVTRNVFTTETTLNKVMVESGCINCTKEEFNKPIKQSTSTGLVLGFIVELLSLYFLACILVYIFSLFKNHKIIPS